MKMKILLLSMVLISGCARSRNYQDEQSYYRSDSSANKSASVAKVEKMGQPKKKIIVLPFMNDTPFGDQELGTAASDELMRLLRGGRKVVVPEDLKTSEVSKDYYTGDKVRLSPLVRLGKQLGVSLVIVGKIKKVRYRQKGDEVGLFRQKRALAAVDVEVRLFDCFEGKEIFFDAKTADSSSSQVNLFGRDEEGDPKELRMQLVTEAVRNSSRLMAVSMARVFDKISWEGRIVKISGGKVFINAGRASGLNLGDILKVMTPGEDVYDPVSGTYMGRSAGQPKGTLEIIDYLGNDGAVSSIHSGGGFFEGDGVQLY